MSKAALGDGLKCRPGLNGQPREQKKELAKGIGAGCSAQSEL
jgi:hypothetical protein